MEENKKPAEKVMEVLRTTKPSQIGDLEFVQKKFIDNYNLCHKGGNGDLMYHRQVNNFKQLIAGSEQLQKCDPFSLYACFVTAAVKDYDLDPQSGEVYMVPLKGKAVLWPQPAADVKRLMTTNQVKTALPAKLVYEGDDYEVEDGRVVKHKERFVSETYIAGYVKFIIDSRGTEKHVTYRRSDWLDWKKKSQQAAGENWSGGVNGQPMAAFLRTKILKHAARDKSWASGERRIGEQFGVEVEDLEEGQYQVQGEDNTSVLNDPKPDKPLKDVVKKKNQEKVIEVEEAEFGDDDFDEIEAEEVLTDKKKEKNGIKFEDEEYDI